MKVRRKATEEFTNCESFPVKAERVYVTICGAVFQRGEKPTLKSHQRRGSLLHGEHGVFFPTGRSEILDWPWEASERLSDGTVGGAGRPFSSWFSVHATLRWRRARVIMMYWPFKIIAAWLFNDNSMPVVDWKYRTRCTQSKKKTFLERKMWPKSH